LVAVSPHFFSYLLLTFCFLLLLSDITELDIIGQYHFPILTQLIRDVALLLEKLLELDDCETPVLALAT
jgi:hypothetical protein